MIFVNPETFLPIVLEASPWRSLISRFYLRLESDLNQLECLDLFRTQNADARFVRTRDRSTIGVMVDFVKMIQFGNGSKELGREDTSAMADRLRRVPIMARKGANPLEMLRSKVQAERALPIPKAP